MPQHSALHSVLFSPQGPLKVLSSCLWGKEARAAAVLDTLVFEAVAFCGAQSNVPRETSMFRNMAYWVAVCFRTWMTCVSRIASE